MAGLDLLPPPSMAVTVKEITLGSTSASNGLTRLRFPLSSTSNGKSVYSPVMIKESTAEYCGVASSSDTEN